MPCAFPWGLSNIIQHPGPNNTVIRSRICATVAMTACYHAAKYGDSWISSAVKKKFLGVLFHLARKIGRLDRFSLQYTLKAESAVTVPSFCKLTNGKGITPPQKKILMHCCTDALLKLACKRCDRFNTEQSLLIRALYNVHLHLIC